MTATNPVGHFVRRAHASLRFRRRRLIIDIRQACIALSLALRRRRRLRDDVEDGVTVVTVTWNSLDFLKTQLRAIEQFTSKPVEIVVVDNASTDGTGEYLRRQPNLRTVPLRWNRGHGLALDEGLHAARTRYVITLDIDAFPVSDEWLDTVIRPLEEGCSLAGAYSSGYIHPCYMAIERQRFLRDGHTFAASYHRRLRLRRRGLPKGWDAGKLITLRDRGRHFRIEPSSIRGPGALGTVFGEVVYHHFYSTRLTGNLTPDVIRSGVTPEISERAWAEAVDRYLINDATS